MYCLACGVEKDLIQGEIYPYPEDDMFDEDRPLPPLMMIEASPKKGGSGYRVVIVCHDCWHKLSPDMWISETCWENIKAITPFAELPKLKRDLDYHERWNPKNYAS